MILDHELDEVKNGDSIAHRTQYRVAIGGKKDVSLAIYSAA